MSTTTASPEGDYWADQRLADASLSSDPDVTEEGLESSGGENGSVNELYVKRSSDPDVTRDVDQNDAGGHTPGPWLKQAPAIGTRRGVAATIVVQSSDGKGVWDVIADVKKCRDGDANARLIASAPELLAALQALRSHNAAEVEMGLHGYASGSQLDKQWKAAEKAIAKATGEQA